MNQLQQFEAALKAVEPQLRAAFIDAVQDIRSSAQLAIVTRAIEESRIADAVRALGADETFWAPLDDAIRAAYLRGGRDAIAALPVIPDPATLGKSLSASRGVTLGRKSGSDGAPGN